MKYGINSLDDVEVAGKTIICRVDINEPVNKETDTLNDITRLIGCAPTLKELSDKGAKVVLLAHQGSDIEYKNFYTTAPQAKELSRLLDREVKFIDDVCGPAAREAIKNLKNGEIILLDNVRFLSEEQTLFEKNLKLSQEEMANTLLVRKLAPLADLYICDAFAASHRSQPSLCGFEQVLPSAMGRLFEKEYCIISDIMEKPARPSVFVLGGGKVADAFMMMKAVLGKGAADCVLTGGLVANIMLWAKGVDIGEPSKGFITKQGYADLVEDAKQILSENGDKIVLPTDLAYVVDEKRTDVKIDALPLDQMLIDIGKETAENYQRIIREAKTVFVNGPMGVFEKEPSELGTKYVWEALGDTEGYTVIGGGDSITATNKYNKRDKINYICTGGGALIRFLTGEELPVVKALRYGSTLKEKQC